MHTRRVFLAASMVASAAAQPRIPKDREGARSRAAIRLSISHPVALVFGSYT
jgi:hypothetical protein